MLLFQWNALRAGDHVTVHDDGDATYGLHAGSVIGVHTRVGRPNDVVVRYDGTGDLVRPRRLAVHLSPVGEPPSCWRCHSGVH